MTIIQLLMEVDTKKRSYSSLYFPFCLRHWEYNKYDWQSWNSVHDYLRDKAFGESDYNSQKLYYSAYFEE